MSLYTNAIVGGEEAPRPLVVVNANKAQDSFWTAVKWIGGALVIITAWREARLFWRAQLGTDEGEREQQEESDE